ncbi:MAG TPA: wax ester/triacylglycerol synthase domain-containing protein [Polyangiaceae bacterium]
MTAFERLSALEATWLALDDERQTQHIVLMAVFEQRSADERALRAHAGASLADWSRARRRLAAVPGVNHPVLSDAPDFEFDWHLRFVDLRERGADALQKLVTRVYAEPLDRHRPLWEQWYVTGHEPDRLVVLTKAHPCLFDERGRLPALMALLRAAPDTRAPSAERVPQATPPAPRELVRHEWQHYRTNVASLGRALGVSGGPSAPVKFGRAARALGSGVGALFAGAVAGRSRQTPRAQSAEPETDWLALSPRERSGGAALGGHHQLVLDAVIRALQSEQSRGGGSSPALALSARLGTTADRGLRPELRLFSVRPEGTTPAGSGAGLLAFAAAESIANVTFVNLATWSAQLLRRRRAVDVVVCEVPAPEDPAYLLDARLLELYPLLPRCMNNPLSVAHTRYADRLFLGLCGTPDVWPAYQDIRSALLRAASTTEE